MTAEEAIRKADQIWDAFLKKDISLTDKEVYRLIIDILLAK
jgi:hypothetical protein